MNKLLGQAMKMLVHLGSIDRYNQLDLAGITQSSSVMDVSTVTQMVVDNLIAIKN